VSQGLKRARTRNGSTRGGESPGNASAVFPENKNTVEQKEKRGEEKTRREERERESERERERERERKRER